MPQANTADDDDIVLPEDQNIPEEEEEELDTDARGDSLEKDDAAAEEGDETNDESEAGQDDTPTHTNDGLIPRHRYESAAQRARDAEAKLAAYEAAQAPASSEAAVEEDSFDKQLMDIDAKQARANADGEFELAAKLAQEARILERQSIQQEMEARNAQTSSATVEQIRLDNAVDALNAAHPELDPDSDTFDQSIVDEVLMLQRSFVSNGANPTKALYDAVRYARVGDEPSAPVVPKRRTDVNRNIDTAKKQPPELAKAGDDSNSSGKQESTPDVNQLTEEEFDALPEATLRRMRGDTN